MDLFEQIARDLEESQVKRYKKSRGSNRMNFYEEGGIEMRIANIIDDLQRTSGTYKYCAGESRVKLGV